MAPPTEESETKSSPDWKLDLARRRVEITMYATQWCGVCRQAREYLEANRIDFHELDTEADSDANQRLGEINPRRTIPTFQIDELVYVGFRQETFETKLNEAAQKHL
jgi:glutaredoxin